MATAAAICLLSFHMGYFLCKICMKNINKWGAISLDRAWQIQNKNLKSMNHVCLKIINLGVNKNGILRQVLAHFLFL